MSEEITEPAPAGSPRIDPPSPDEVARLAQEPNEVPTIRELHAQAEEGYAQASAAEDAINRIADPTQSIAHPSGHGHYRFVRIETPNDPDAGAVYAQVLKD